MVSLRTDASVLSERIAPLIPVGGMGRFYHTACKIPFAPDYIRKVAARGAIGKKRKTAKC